jgi:hypothetical protein
MEKLRIWWIPQIPSDNPFKVDVKDLTEAKKLLNTLAEYDKYQFENRIKPDYSNTGGLEFFDGKEWTEFEDEEGEDIWNTTLIDTTKPLKKIKEGLLSTRVKKEDILRVAEEMEVGLTHKEMDEILENYPSAQQDDTTATWNIVVGNLIGDTVDRRKR